MQQNQQKLHLSLTYNQYKQREQRLQGYRIGQYTIIKELGKGSFGKVFKATNQRGDIFAIKMLDKKGVRLQKNRRIKQIKERLILSEPKLMQQCDSVNLLKCFEIFENEDLKVLIIEYCDGLTLAEELKKIKQRNLNKPFSQKQAVDILRHIINGIAELHKHKIVHRDLKTDNIMKHEGIYKIIDFGFSKKLQLTHQSQATKNTILGTPTTMAPQVMFHKNYGLKADIWSIGVIFFEIVFGIPPYDSSNAKRFYQQIEKRFEEKEPSPFKGVTLSKEAHDFLEKVLKVDPDKRIGWRDMIQHPLIKIKKEERLTDPFQERHPMVDPVVDKQLEVGSLIERQLQFSEEEIKELKIQPEPPKQTKITNQNLSQKDRQKQREVSKDNKKKKLEINLEQLIEQQRQEARLKKRRQKNKQIQLKIISRQASLADSSTNVRFTQRQELSSIYGSRVKYASQFMQCRSIHLQCLKSEFILKEIIEPIQSRNMINFEKRQSIELMHLLVSRCFKNLSLIQDKLKNNPEELHRSFSNLKNQVQNIYKIIVLKFNDYDTKLLAIQNKYTQIAKDFFLKIFKKSDQKYKNTIIGGVELKEDSESQFYDFKKSEQIQYTRLYINRLIPQIKNIGGFSERVKKHLKKYDMIMAISLETLREQSFQNFVQKQLEL